MSKQTPFKIDKGVPLPDAWPGFVRTLSGCVIYCPRHPHGGGPMILRRILLSLLVAASAAQLPGCGVTEWQRFQDDIEFARAARQDLHTGPLARAIEEAKEETQ